ncbi:MAG: hypothetical protein NTW21_43275 [Verrucomicrobia bacterium]|nr:hypothetical protein [Verrucomicrobiota bacterium]
MKQMTTLLLLVVLASPLSYGDVSPAPAPEVNAPPGAQAVAPDGKIKITETQAQDVAVARNHMILHAEMVTEYPHTMRQVIHGTVAPTHLAQGEGMEIRIERTGYTAEDWKHGRGGEVHVWLMPKDYQPGTQPGGAQVAPAHETITWRAWRVFVWGSGGTDWPTWENDLTAALQKAATTATQAPADPPPLPADMANGKRLSKSDTPSPMVRDAGQCTLRATLDGYAGAVAFSPDGKTLASGNADNTIKLWNVAIGHNTATFNERPTAREAYVCGACSPDGITLALGNSNAKIELWEVKPK